MFAPSSRTRRKRASSDPPVLRLNTGADMPQIGFGTWGIKPAEVASAVKAAIAAGYRTLDLAPVYRNQEEVGSALASAFAEGRINTATLVWSDGGMASWQALGEAEVLPEVLRLAEAPANAPASFPDVPPAAAAAPYAIFTAPLSAPMFNPGSSV